MLLFRVHLWCPVLLTSMNRKHRFRYAFPNNEQVENTIEDWHSFRSNPNDTFGTTDLNISNVLPSKWETDRKAKSIIYHKRKLYGKRFKKMKKDMECLKVDGAVSAIMDIKIIVVTQWRPRLIKIRNIITTTAACPFILMEVLNKENKSRNKNKNKS